MLLASVILFTTTTTWMMSLSTSTPCHCEDPPEILSRKSENMEEMVFHWLKERNLTNLPHSPESDYNFLLEEIATTTLLGSKDCPRNRRRQAEMDDYQRALCPWYYALDIDDDRVPRVMVHAQCSCKRCQFSAGRHSGHCTAVKHGRRVLRRVGCDVDGFYVYRELEELIPVGCACVRATIRPLRNQAHTPP